MEFYSYLKHKLGKRIQQQQQNSNRLSVIRIGSVFPLSVEQLQFKISSFL